MNKIDKWLQQEHPRTFAKVNKQKQVVAGIVRAACDKMVPHIREKLGYPEWTPRVSVSFDYRRVRSYGGVKPTKGWWKNERYYPYMSLACFPLLEDGKGEFNEYASFADDTDIGNLPINSPREQCVWALVAHELAHCVQWSLMYIVDPRKKKFVKYAHGGLTDRGHGVLWKEIYRDLRVNFVNGGVPMEAVEQTNVAAVNVAGQKVAKPVKEKRVTNRSKVNAIFNANKDKKTSDVVALVMEELKVSKSYAYTYVYLARKEAGMVG